MALAWRTLSDRGFWPGVTYRRVGGRVGVYRFRWLTTEGMRALLDVDMKLAIQSNLRGSVAERMAWTIVHSLNPVTEALGIRASPAQVRAWTEPWF